MSQTFEITETDIRESLISRAKAYSKATGASFSAISIAAVKDSKFLSRVENRKLGFNIKTYQKMVEWLDHAERKHARETAA